MNIVVLGAKGSAVTTTALALAGSWPALAGPVAFVEADASGGDLAARFDLPASPSLLTAAASLQQPTFGLLLEHTHSLPGGVRVVAAPASAVEVAGGMSDFTRAVLAPMRHRTDGHLLIDAGRQDARSLPALAMHADLVVVVVRQDMRSAPSTVGRCLHAQQLLAALLSRGLPAVAVMVGDAPYRAADIAQFLGVPVLGTLPEDPFGASHLSGHPASARAARRSSLATAAAGVAAALSSEIVPTASSAPASTRRRNRRSIRPHPDLPPGGTTVATTEVSA